MATVTFDNVTKRYGSVLAVEDLNLAVDNGGHVTSVLR